MQLALPAFAYQDHAWVHAVQPLAINMLWQENFWQHHQAVYIAGPKQSGKSHLMQVIGHWHASRTYIYIPCYQGMMIHVEELQRYDALYGLDDIDHLSSVEQTVLFNALNNMHQRRQIWLMTASVLADRLPYFKDLTSRLKACMSFTLQKLMPKDVEHIIKQRLCQMGAVPSKTFLTCLMQHTHYHPEQTFATLDRFNHHALTHHYRLCTATFKRWLQQLQHD
jgi:chromosomal replication initiation ATPase DnaA